MSGVIHRVCLSKDRVCGWRRVRLRHSLSNYWPMVFHHVVTLVSYGCVCVYRRAPPLPRASFPLTVPCR